MRKLVALVVVLVQLSGCATLFRGTSQKVRVDTNPSGGVIVYEGKRYQAPVTLTLKRSREHVVYVEREGLPPAAAIIDAKELGLGAFIGWVTIDLFLGFIPAFVDFGTSALTAFPDKVTFPALIPGDASADAADEGAQP